MEIDKSKLEKSLSSKGGKKTEELKMSKEVEIGFHEGALNTLAAERIELVRVVQNVEKIMSMHLSRLEELGVKIEAKKE
ncbi:hypothetical protein J4411_00900 [Candidatus Pacearchaeota archaeon]|nr:hypothetical protein [Candidatus Pacearchaeota archaeon]